MAIVLLDGTIVKVNQELLDLLGYEEGDLIGTSVATFSLTDDAASAERMEELTSTDATHSRVTQLRRKDGSLVNAVTSALVVRNQEGESRYVIARAALADGNSERLASGNGAGKPLPTR
jgi:PAS domain S-box-containing protein